MTRPNIVHLVLIITLCCYACGKDHFGSPAPPLPAESLKLKVIGERSCSPKTALLFERISTSRLFPDSLLITADRIPTDLRVPGTIITAIITNPTSLYDDRMKCFEGREIVILQASKY